LEDRAGCATMEGVYDAGNRCWRRKTGLRRLFSSLPDRHKDGLKRAIATVPRRHTNRLRRFYLGAVSSLVSTFRSYSTESLLASLRSLGVHDGDSVMLHSSFDPDCGFKGTIADLTDTFLEAVGPTGNLLMVSLPYRTSSRKYLDQLSRFDVRKTPSGMGLVSEFFRRRAEVLRSLHPTHPVLVCGPKASWYVEDHDRSLFPCGSGTPFGKLLEENGKVLFFNVRFATFTFFHYIEDLVKDRLPFPLYHDPAHEVPVVDHTGESTTVKTHVFSDEAIRRRRFQVLEDELRSRGLIVRRKLKNTVLEAVNVREAVDCAEDMFRNQHYFYDMTDAGSASSQTETDSGSKT
jgi:aminoglycoside 3-N-acetyltransferase